MNKFHPIIEYLEAQDWDGTKRIDRLFIDYLGADDTSYTREVTRKMLVAAVKRLYEPGCKFDYMLVLVGAQGAGKSTIIQKLAMRWFSDSLKTFDTKEAGEHLQSAWIFEFGELAGMTKAEVDEIKQFITKRSDKYRVAYDRVITDFPRKCVFFGSTNNWDFLKDPT
ncbi:virulence-associated E family protein, partial [Paenibacillus larvae]